ncbi:MAG: N-acetylmuramoyl-L-alanine amidase [Pseudomonadota bacterium]
MAQTPLRMLVLFAAVMLGTARVAMAAPVIAGVSVTLAGNGAEQLKFESNEPLTVVKTFTLANPNRIVIDVAQATGKSLALPRGYKGKLLKNIRFGQFDPATSRIVLDVSAPAKVIGTTPGRVLMIEIAPAEGASAEAVAPVVEAKPLIVIDAGHGGQDPGAIGLHQTREKEVTLNFARALREELLRTGRYRVALTRDNDTFVLLPDRVAIARKMKADMFISLHADSNPRAEAKGLSIYTLSETASDAEAAALAERENKSDIIPGIDLSTTDADVASILIDLTQRETMNKSAVLADNIVDAMHAKVNRLPQTHRFAGFRVLKGPDIPSVLIEIGFISNAVDERLLLSPEYRDLVVASIVKGIDRYRAGE